MSTVNIVTLSWLILVLFFASFFTTPGKSIDVAKERSKRFLLFPRANPQRLQMIGGFGIPVDLQLESITVGYVFKSVYLLPWNSSHWIPPILDRHELETQRRHRREPLVVSNPANYERYDGPWKEASQEPLPESNVAEDSRWMFYRVLVQLFEQKGLNGRSCVLRAICESSEAGFTHTSGLIGELMQIAFTPSSTNDVAREPEHELYRHAEMVPVRVSARGIGRSVCADMYTECNLSLLDSFSSVFGKEFGTF